MNFARKHDHGAPAKNRLVLVALVDVVLFLLMYFMFAGTLTPPEADLSAGIGRSSTSGGSAGILTPQVLTVQKSASGGVPEYRIGARVMTSEAALLDVLKALPKGTGVFVKVMGDVPIEAAAAALQACKDAGFDRVSYVPGE
jgi:biopolymer transport protein ExbD